MSLDVNLHTSAFVFSRTDKNSLFYWHPLIKDMYKKRYNKELKDDYESRINNVEVLTIVNDYLESEYKASNQYEEANGLNWNYQVLIIEKEAEKGIDFMDDYAFFNSYKYIVKKLQSIIVDINSSSYVSLLMHRMKQFKQMTVSFEIKT